MFAHLLPRRRQYRFNDGQGNPASLHFLLNVRLNEENEEHGGHEKARGGTNIFYWFDQP